MAKLKTQLQKDKATSARLLKTYGITLLEYDEMLREQGSVCKICQRPPTGRRLHVDHCHNLVKTRINSFRVLPGKWVASIEDLGIERFGATKSEAIRKTRQALKKRSTRGILCWHCNAGLEKFHDDPEILASAAIYIKNFHSLLGAPTRNSTNGDSNV